jgi:hypothetical protein
MIRSAPAIAGGTIWVVGAVGWLLTHGTQANWNTAAILGMTGTEFTRLLIAAAALWAIALALDIPHRTGARVSWAVSLAGVAMVGVGALFETSIVDPVAEFTHPIVQSGWLLFIGGLFPALFAGMLLLAATSSASRADRLACLAIGVTAPLPVVAFFVGALNASGAVGVTALGLMHAAPGIAWISLGLVRRGARATTAADSPAA